MKLSTRSWLRISILLFASISAFLTAKSNAAFGDLYVVDSFSGAVSKYTPAGTETVFASGLAPTPNHLAFDTAGNLYVNEGNGDSGKITKIAPNGTKTPFASGVNVGGLTCDAAGNLFVSDAVTQSILKFTPAGAKTTFAAGVNTLDLVWINGFDGPALYATDFGSGFAGQGKVYVFTADGTKFTFVDKLNRPRRLAANGSDLFIANTDGVILIYNTLFGDGSDPTYATGLGNIQGMACDSSHSLFVSTASAIIKFTNPGRVRSTFVPESDPAGLAFERPRDPALNISTRLAVQQGENVLIAGFIITGPDHKSVLVRGMGPSLGKLGVPNPLLDPTIEMHFPTGAVISNDNWKNGNAAGTIQGTSFAPSDDRESALAFNIPPGNYSVIEKGVNNTAGVGIVEVYDLQPTENSSLANISTRGFVGVGDNVMIGGFILGGGNGAGRVVIRAIGPSLSAAGISNPLGDPTVELRNGSGVLVASNNDWEQSGESLDIEAIGLPPSNGLESALIVTLPAGNYTAIVAGNDGGAGVGLVEVYNLR